MAGDRSALAWIDGPGDRDHDGFVEYFKATPRGLSNQGWKDSQDAVFHADGRLAEGPIALAEVQGYVYAAKKLASWCADRCAGNPFGVGCAEIPVPMAPVMRTNVNFQIETGPADNIRPPFFLPAETSERRHFSGT